MKNNILIIILMLFFINANALGAATYAIGDTGPAGGIVFHITDGGLHGLEAAAVDQVSTRWGCFGVLIPGAAGTAVGTGAQNTADIIAGCDETTAASVAAAVGPGWFLPSRDELNLLYAQKVSGGTMMLNFRKKVTFKSSEKLRNKISGR